MSCLWHVTVVFKKFWGKKSALWATGKWRIADTLHDQIQRLHVTLDSNGRIPLGNWPPCSYSPTSFVNNAVSKNFDILSFSNFCRFLRWINLRVKSFIVLLYAGNKQLRGYVVKRLYSPRLLSWSLLCLENAWCISTNYTMSSKKGIKGTCELNKHRDENSLINENTNFDQQLRVTFSMLVKVILVR